MNDCCFGWAFPKLESVVVHFIDLNGCYLWIAITSWVQLNTEHDAKIENIENEIE